MTLDEYLQKVKTDLEAKPNTEVTDEDKMLALLGAILLELQKP